MDSAPPLLMRIDGQHACDEQAIGGKADKLSQLARAGFRVPGGFCLTTRAYETFLQDADLAMVIRMELGRKSMDEMRWEEIWDAALRIRAAFLSQPLSGVLREAIAEGLRSLDAERPMAVRSSALGEDSAGRSFAGLHESIVGVRGQQAVEDAVRVVWASLWSDAALLYRKELGLDPARSRMAVIVQEMVDGDRSGVAFGRDPRDASKEHAIIESVPGPCSGLVDGLVDPDRWELDRQTRGIITWFPGERDGADAGVPLLEPHDLERILQTLQSIEDLFRWPPDMEWTGRSDAFTVLQARPITTTAPDDDEQRAWYLTLRPGDGQLKELHKRVAEQLIPELEAEGSKLAAEQLDRLHDQELAHAIEQRSAAVARWKKVYWDQFIPFAHGVRRLATYYNDAVRPEDPYEFVGLLRDQPLIATQRNHAIEQLARQLAADETLRSAVEQMLQNMAETFDWPTFRDELTRMADGAAAFLRSFDDLTNRFLDIAYDHERLHDQPEPLLRNIAELAKRSSESNVHESSPSDSALACQQRLLTAVGPDRQEEAQELIEIGRVSWKLRDDDNLLVARLESQLLRALEVAANRLRSQGRLTGEGRPTEAHIDPMNGGLREPSSGMIVLDDVAAAQESTSSRATSGETPRQLIGQPASPGVATGKVRCIRGREDLGDFQQGEILVCDAIQPTMTHLVPLASGIVERRGGMLIHGAIIARELGIPCVNGVRKAADLLTNGDLVTVDGFLGIVTVGPAEFDLELMQTG